MTWIMARIDDVARVLDRPDLPSYVGPTWDELLYGKTPEADPVVRASDGPPRR